MPRDASGNFTLVAGNPVVSGTPIESNWANTTMPDFAVAIEDSLSRSGLGGMLAPLKAVDGTAALPAFAFNNDPNSGVYRVSDTDVRFALGGVDVLRWTDTAVQLWDVGQAAWFDLVTTDTIPPPPSTNEPIVVEDVDVTDYTLSDADLNKILYFNAATAVTVNVPDSLSVGFNVELIQASAGKLIMTPAGTAAFLSKGQADRTVEQGSPVAVQKLDATTVFLAGDIEADQVVPPTIPTGALMLSAYEAAEVGAVSPVYTLGDATDGFRRAAFTAPTGEVVARSGEAINTGMRYFEIVIDTFDDAAVWELGVVAESPNDYDESYFLANNAGSSNTFDGTNLRTDLLGTPFGAGDVVQFFMDFDTQTYEYSVNEGAKVTFSFGDVFTQSVVPAIKVQSGHAGSAQFTINYIFGDLAFTLPENFSPWIGTEVGDPPVVTPDVITWAGDSVSASSFTGTSSEARYTFFSDGGAAWRKNLGATVNRTNWLTPKTVGIGSDYELAATIVSGVSPQNTNVTLGGTFNDLTLGLFIELIDTNPAFGGVTSVLDVTIREKANTSNSVTAQLTLSADYESGA